jgi:hypothetical protein
VILRIVQLPDGLFAVDLECSEAHRFERRFLPFPLEVRDRPGKPTSRWIYRVRPV